MVQESGDCRPSFRGLDGRTPATMIDCEKEIARTGRRALEFDGENNNMLWGDAVAEELQFLQFVCSKADLFTKKQPVQVIRNLVEQVFGSEQQQRSPSIDAWLSHEGGWMDDLPLTSQGGA